MSFVTGLFSRFKLSPRDADVIFDRDEPIGQPTDLVLSGRRWFRRSKETAEQRRDSVPLTASQAGR